jgi:hypothetical protein
MSKLVSIIAILFAAWIADQYYNYGSFTDGLLSMLREIRHSFGWYLDVKETEITLAFYFWRERHHVFTSAHYKSSQRLLNSQIEAVRHLVAFPDSCLGAGLRYHLVPGKIGRRISAAYSSPPAMKGPLAVWPAAIRAQN